MKLIYNILLTVVIIVFVTTGLLIAKTETPSEKTDAESTQIADPNANIDHNDVELTMRGLEKALKNVNKDSKREIQQWMKGTMEDRAELFQVMQTRVINELTLIRDLAALEGAEKTTEAVNNLITEKKATFETWNKKMELAKKRFQKLEEKERRSKDRRSKGTRR